MNGDPSKLVRGSSRFEAGAGANIAFGHRSTLGAPLESLERIAAAAGVHKFLSGPPRRRPLLSGAHRVIALEGGRVVAVTCAPNG